MLGFLEEDPPPDLFWLIFIYKSEDAIFILLGASQTNYLQQYLSYSTIKDNEKDINLILPWSGILQSIHGYKVQVLGKIND